MNAAKIEIKPHEKHLNHFRCVLVSKPNPFGCTTLEIICSAETLRQIRNACNEALEEDKVTQGEENSIFRTGRLKDFGK